VSAMPSILGPDGRPVSAERVRMEKQTRFNPISNWGPDVLVRQLVAYARGEIAPLSWVMEWLETHDEVIQTVAPKAKAAVSRYGYDILMKDEVPPDRQGMAEDQQGRVQEFYQNLRATDAVDQETGGGTRLLFQQVMDGYGKGYAAHHIVWNPGATLSAELVKVPTWFFEVKTGRLQFLPSTWALDGVPLESLGGRGAWMISRGRGVMLAGTIARMFKQIPLQDWLTYCDRHGMPAFVGKTRAAKGTAGWNDMAQAVGSIGSEWGAVINVDDVLEVLDLKGSGELPYEKLVDRMDRAQVMLWRGGDLSTISRGGGAVGANPQSEETDELDADNAAWVSETLQRNLTERVIRYYFGENAPVLVEIKLRTKTRDNVRQDMQAVKQAKDFGVKVSRSWFTKKFGIVEAEEGEAALGDGETQDGKTPADAQRAMADRQDARQEAVNAEVPVGTDNSQIESSPVWLDALADDMQPLGKALAAAMQAGDDEAVKAALRKLSATLPEFLETPGLEEWMGKAMASALIGDGETAANDDKPPRFKKDGTPWAPYDEAKHKRDKGRYAFKAARDWKPDQSLPEIGVDEARAILKAGRTVGDPLGNNVLFDESLERHWEAEGKLPGDIARRLATLPEAMRTVEHPHEVWRDGETSIYFHRHGAKEGMTAFVEITAGKAATYYPAEHFAKLQAKITKLSKNPANLLWSRARKGGQD
jgi:phage gp29-like protein